MTPYLFKIGSFELRYYSLMIIIGLLLSIYFTRRRAKSLGVKPETIENIIIVTFVSALIGARIYYVALKWGYYSEKPLEIFAIWHGGLAVHGGVIGGAIGAIIYSLKLKMKPMFTGDIIAPWLLLAQGLGRFGNFANGEAHGVPVITPPSVIFSLLPKFNDFWSSMLGQLNLFNNPKSVSSINNYIDKGVSITFEGNSYPITEHVPWGISFSDRFMPAAYIDFGTLAVHPTFFYEMILNFIGAAVMYYFWRKDNWIASGGIFGMYLIFYGFIRAFVTFFRADDLMIGYIRAPHLASAGFVIVGLILLVRGMKIAESKGVKI